MALSTVIEQLQERERRRDEREAKLDRPRMVENWRHDIDDVFAVIRSALKPYEDDGRASIAAGEIEVAEELLGKQTYARLLIEIVGLRVVVVPVARFTIGGTGRLDMYRENRPSEEHRVLIVRGAVMPGLDAAEWLIEQKGEVPIGLHGPLLGYARGHRRYHRLEAASVESAMEYLLTLS